MQETDNKGDIARKSKNKADEDYRTLVLEMGVILEFAMNSGFVFLDELEAFQASLLQTYAENDSSLLLENMQVVRTDYTEKNYYSHHAVNVALLNAMMGGMLNITGEQLHRLVKLGLVLDFGMLRLPAELRSRGRQFTSRELAQLRTHARETVSVLEKSNERDAQLIEEVCSHHERFDGSGYPQGLKGMAIPENARVAAVADTFDAAMSRKSFGVRKSPFDILAELLENPGMKLDPSIVRVVVVGFANLMVGRYILLSDRSVARVVAVDLNNISYPIVNQLNRRIQTGPQLYPVEFTGYFPMF